MCDGFSFCLCVRTITLIAPASTVEFVLCSGEETDENRAYEKEDEYFNEEDLCEAGEGFVHDFSEAASEGAVRGGRILGILVLTVVQEWGGLWI